MTNNEELIEFIQLIQDEMSGAIIEVKNPDGRWSRKTKYWDTAHHYRIKPEPRIRWAAISPDHQWDMYESKTKANEYAGQGAEIVKMMEMLDDE